MGENEISYIIVDSAIEVHRTLGPGLLESVYKTCLIREISLRNIPLQEEVAVPVQYKGLIFETTYRLDLLVAEKVIVELKVVENLLPLHKAQLLSYLRLTRKKLGLLINFNVPALKDGIKRVVNNL
ncbi:MAG: GxxExxY protein [Gammaproteobacteria bacterium]